MDEKSGGLKPLTEEAALRELREASAATKAALDRLNAACAQLLAVRAIRQSRQQ
jgi:hypothetical protein